MVGTSNQSVPEMAIDKMLPINHVLLSISTMYIYIYIYIYNHPTNNQPSSINYTN